MNKYTVIGWAFAAGLISLAVASSNRNRERSVAAIEPAPPPVTRSTAEANEGQLYGRIITENGAVYEGRLRFGGDEEALWGNYFNGVKKGNPWARYVPSEQLPKEESSFKVFGLVLSRREHPVDLGRPLMVRLGDIARIDARGRDFRVMMKSGTVHHLQRYAADDLADGVRVWDGSRGVIDIDEWPIRTIEFLGSSRSDDSPTALYGTVRTRQGDFTGFVQWNRKACLVTDALEGHTADGEFGVRFESIRSIARHSQSRSLVTLLDGREIVLSGSRDVGEGNGGMYVDDPRYGRVLISWDAFDRVDFSPGGGGPTYSAYPPAGPLTGTVITRSGRQLAGRLVYDLDESETTETLDAPSLGIDYTIPFALIASIVLPSFEERSDRKAKVTLQSGEELQLALAGDLGKWNAGMLIFVAGRERPEYVPWTDVQQIDFDRPPEK